MNQLFSFSKVDCSAISINESAERLGVSSATIRNWLKAEYLDAVQGGVSLASIERFEKNNKGINKLTHRANKSSKDKHDHQVLAATFLQKLQMNEMRSSVLAESYESSLSESYKNKEGIYYTPVHIVQHLFSEHIAAITTKTFCDPCCGSGNFIMQALKLGFSPENIYGFDTDLVAVETTKARIYEATGYMSKNIYHADFLAKVQKNQQLKFDYIYTNPPWGKKLTRKEKESYATSFHTGASKDTCSLFFFACLKCLHDGGKLGLLLPESFFNIGTFEAARNKALLLSIERLIDYGKAFKGLMTAAQAIVLENSLANRDAAIRCEQIDGQQFYAHERSITSFQKNPKAILNHSCQKEDVHTIDYLMSLPHDTLKNKAAWGLGIVTGDNKRFVKKNQEAHDVPVYKGADITPNGLKSATHFITPHDFDSYQQVAPLHLYHADHKLIYKFISARLCFFYDDKQRLILNSANMLIPHKGFAVNTKVLGALLSSDFMNWLFKSLFNTHKVLRGDIESLPIFSQHLQNITIFNENEYIDKINILRQDDGTYRIKT